ncbi:MAG: hypothetical protein V8R75_13430 [Oscillospiraceae bacterium]
MPEAAQQRVSAYYQEQGLLYDTQAELERAYPGPMWMPAVRRILTPTCWSRAFIPPHPVKK